MRKSIVGAAVSLSVMVAVVPAVAQSPQPAPAAAPTGAPAYLATAASADQFEIQSSQHALQVSTNAEVKSAAQMIIADHTRLSAELKNAAASARMAPPRPALMPRHQTMLDRLKTVKPADFDAAYGQAQIMAHREALNLHQTYADRGDNEVLRQAAARAVPVIRAHLEHVQALKAAK